MTIDKIQFTYRAYVEWLKRAGNYRAGSIGLMLLDNCKNQWPSAFKTMEELGFETFTPGCWTMAGEMIINNEKIDV